MLNVIKEYLVSLGYHVDNPSFNKAQNSINRMGKLVNSFADSSVVKFAAVGASIAAFAGVSAIALQQFMRSVADADLKNEIFARRMWMNKDAAVSYKHSLDALGVSLQDLYMSPELMSRFMELRQQAYQMTPPAGFSNAMKGIRDLTFEWQRFKLEGSYAVYWVSYYLTKYLNGPLSGTKFSLKEINDIITQKMPYWTKNIAYVVSLFVRMGNSALKFGEYLKRIWDGLGPNTQKAIVAIMAVRSALFLLALPLAPLILGLTALLLLIDDFMAYKEGRESMFPELWKEVKALKDELANNGSLEEFAKTAEEIVKQLKEMAISIHDILNEVARMAGFENFAEMFRKTVVFVFDVWLTVLKNIKSTLEVINALLDVTKGKMSGNERQVDEGIQKLKSGGSKFFTNDGPFSHGVFGDNPFG
ncbi:MAG: hypothetical protein ACYC2P_13510, partial [Paludibacteraceae bacterium]